MKRSKYSQLLWVLLLVPGNAVWASSYNNLDSNDISMSQQSVTTKGTVVDTKGMPLIGVSILEKGTTNGTITDIDGNITLNTAAGATLEISNIGYKT